MKTGDPLGEYSVVLLSEEAWCTKASKQQQQKWKNSKILSLPHKLQKNIPSLAILRNRLIKAMSLNCTKIQCFCRHAHMHFSYLAFDLSVLELSIVKEQTAHFN